MKLSAQVRSSLTRRASLSLSNSTSRAIVVWHPCYVERHEDGTVVAGSGFRGPVLLPAKTGAPAQRIADVTVQLTGTNYGKWRLRAPVSVYGPLAVIDSLFRKPQGWTLGSPIVRFTLRHLSRTAVTDWMEETEPWPELLQEEHRRAFMNLSQAFRRELDRWPTNVIELQGYAATKGQPGLEGHYKKAIFAVSEDDRFTARFPQGGYTSFGAGPAVPFEPGAALSDRIAKRRSSIFHRRSESMTLMFILRNFRTQFNRWPANMEEFEEFVTTQRQPAIPAQYKDATLHPQPDGGLKVRYNDGNGEMSLH